MKDQVAHWELKYMGSHKEINELKDEVHLWKEKSEMHRTKYEKITVEINSHTSSSHHYEKRVEELEGELKRLKLALYTMKETHEHD